jgi:hypothetical protein
MVSHLPNRLQQKDIRLIFSTANDGWSLNTLYQRAAAHGPSILIAQTKDGKKVGCFTSHAWRIHKKPFGNLHCFVFESHSDLRIADHGDFHVFNSVEVTQLTVGGKQKPILDEDEQWGALPDEMFGEVNRVQFKAGSLGIIFTTDIHGYGAIVKSIVPGGQAGELHDNFSFEHDYLL